jgi:urease beta subunit
MRPGEILVDGGELELAPGRERRIIAVMNRGDRPIQIGSHFHFAEVNVALAFERADAQGFRLDVPAGTSVRFEPGVDVDVTLVALAGNRLVPGLQVRM